MIKIIIADDHLLTREGFKNRISNGTIDMKVTGEASNASELMKLLAEEIPDIVVLDITMPGKSGLDILKDIKNLYPAVHVLVLSMHPEERYAFRVFKAGAAGYLSKDHENISQELIRVIRMIVTQKRRYISDEVANELAQYIHENQSSKKHKTLSDREFQILCMIAAGKKIRSISEELSITVQTVYTYRNRVKEKLNLKTDADFTKYAIQNNLIES